MIADLLGFVDPAALTQPPCCGGREGESTTMLRVAVLIPLRLNWRNTGSGARAPR